MTEVFLKSLSELKGWVESNEVRRDDGELLSFKVQPISAEEMVEIRLLTRNALPESYYYFLREIGSGEFFISAYSSCFELYDLSGLIGYNELFQQEVEDAEEIVEEKFFMIGHHCAMGDWMGFCISKPDERNFDVYCHEYPIEEYVETSDELSSWRTFENYIIKVVETKGLESL